MQARSRNSLILLGVFVVASLALFTWLSFRIGGLGASTSNLYFAEFDDATGLAMQSDIKIAGINVGKVNSMGLSDQETARVGMALNEGIVVREGSRVVIKSKSLLGEMFLAIEPGPKDAPVLAVGSTISNTYSPLRIADLGEVMGPFVESLDPEKVDKALTLFFDIIEENQDAFRDAGKKAVRLLDVTTSLLEDNQTRITKILIAAVKASDEVNRFLAKHGGTLDTAVENMGEASVKVNTVLGKVDSLLDDAPETVDEVARLLKRSNKLMAELDELDPMHVVEIAKLILQKEGLTVNLGKRSEGQIKDDLEYYESILARQGAEAQPPLDDDASTEATGPAK